MFFYTGKIETQASYFLQQSSGKRYWRDTEIGQYSPADTILTFFADGEFRFQSAVGSTPTNYLKINSNGDISFGGSAGFYPRVLDQADEPAAGTGATECDTGELLIWTDTDDSKCYLCYNHGGTVKTVELA